VIRRGNATTLRERLDQIFAQDPHADLIVGGDFNSQYNQSQAYPEMGQTGINTVLQSQGDELALRGPLTGGLYNLWFELPKSQRGSDVYRDQWGTLMQIMIPRGLYDKRGIQYVDNSFRVLRQENVNAQAGSQLPIRWAQVGPIGGGYSDHFPLEMQFHVVATSDRMAYLSLETPGTPDVSSDQAPARSVDFAAAKRATVRSLNDLGSDAAVCDPGNLGHVFQVEAVVSGERPFRVRLFEQDYNLWAFDVDLRREIYRRFAVGQAIKIHAEVGIHQEQWQLVVRDRSWIDP
jgi:hypothetical protein